MKRDEVETVGGTLPDPCANSNKAMSAAVSCPLGSSELQTAHSNARINVCDHNLLHNYFLHMFEKSEETQPPKDKGKKSKKSRKCSKNREKRPEPLTSLFCTVPEIQISRNASWFAMFASVRRTCLEHQSRAAMLLQAAATSAWQEPTESEGDGTEAESTKQNLPKVVSIGIKAVFDIIKETESSHPEVCQRALTSLLDVLQGLHPEDLRDEPNPVTETLFTILLELANRTGQPASINGNLEPGNHIRALSCSCLLSLAVAHGSSPYLLRATAALLMSPRSHAGEHILLPLILATLQRSVFSIIIKRTDHPDFMSHGVPISCLMDTFSMQQKEASLSAGACRVPPKAMGSGLCYGIASDGHYLYLHLEKAGLFKVGTGYSETVKGYVYSHKPDFFPDEPGWLGWASDTLFFKPNNTKGYAQKERYGEIELLILDNKTLEVTKVVSSVDRYPYPHLMLTDGTSVGIVTSAGTKDDTLAVKFLSVLVNPMVQMSELPIKLARKCVEVIGSSVIMDESSPPPPAPASWDRLQLDFPIDEEIVQVGAGREFALLLTGSGKLFYTGKSCAIGHKQPCLQGKWNEVVFSKSGSSSSGSGTTPTGSGPGSTPPVVVSHFSIGHDGSHALIVSEEGTVYFTGTAKRGEDGDLQSKPRRPPKAKKPSRMTALDRHTTVVSTACNSGTSCIVTKKGELFVFGKDSSVADYSTGRVTAGELAGQNVVSVAIGKAHVVVLTSKQEVFTFGVNNKGQCGRDFPTAGLGGAAAAPSYSGRGGSILGGSASGAAGDAVAGAAGIAADPASIVDGDDVSDQEGDGDGYGPWGRKGRASLMSGDLICMPNKHIWKHEQCMVCSVCGQCTGYGAGCVSANNSDRNPGMLCGCGSGDSGCSECGCCRICAEDLPGEGDGAGGIVVGGQMVQPAALGAGENRDSMRYLIRMNLMAHKQPREMGKALDYRDKFIKRRLSKIGKDMRGRRNGKLVDPFSGLVIGDKKGNVKEVQPHEETEKDLGKVSSLGPGRVSLPPDCLVTAIACGLHHTLLLTTTGFVFAFGSNSHGQLGVGDLVPRGAPVLVNGIDEPVTKICAGAYHSVVLTQSGRVFTWGNNSKGQLGRNQPSHNGGGAAQKPMLTPVEQELWYAFPGQVTGLGIAFGKVVTWINASAEQTLFKLDESLINSQNLQGASIVANRHHILLLPTQNQQPPVSFQSLCISRQDGFCRSFSSIDQVEWNGKCVALDPLYNVLWSHCNHTNAIQCYNPTGTDVDRRVEAGGHNILSSDLALPVTPGCLVSRSQAALNLLSCLDTVTASAPTNLTPHDDDQGLLSGIKTLSKEDFSAVNRFDSHGGGWGYSGHSVEAVRFSVDCDVLIGGYGLFGGRGEYVGKIKLFDIGPEGGEQEGDGDLIAESDELTYECGLRQKYPVMFEEPVQIVTGRWYVAWVRVSGPSSDCGSSGQSQVLTEDQVTFSFKSSKKSNNGTDVNAGQIPQILYRIVTHESANSGRKYSPPEPVHILTGKFGKPLTTDSFQALLSLLQWAWNTFKVTVGELVDTMPSQASLLDLKHLVFICRASLRLLASYVEHIYPSPTSQSIDKDSQQPFKSITETQRLAECVFEVRSQLIAMLSDPLAMLNSIRKSGQPANLRHQAIEMCDVLLKDAHKTFVACFHAFYPTGPLKWVCLCSLLNSLDTQHTGKLLAAAIDALCNPMIKLRNTFPIGVPDGDKAHGGKTESPVENISVTGSMLYLGEMTPTCKYPILSEVMNYQSQTEAVRFGSWTFTDVLNKLLNIVSLPVRQSLQNTTVTYSNELVNKSCRLIASVISELCNMKGGPEATLANIANKISVTTPNRFARINTARTWNTGGGSPDAICFSVDKPGILISGAGVFGGLGVFDYELELLHEHSSRDKDCNQSQRWISMEICHGSYSADDCSNDIYFIKFEKPVAITPHTKYALRLRNHGGQTCNGDGGQSSIKGPDGTTFTFTSCSLSFNGTNPTRGQIPQILYFSSTDDQNISNTSVNMAQSMSQKSALSLTVTVCRTVSGLLNLTTPAAAAQSGDTAAAATAAPVEDDGRVQEVLNNAPVVTTLLPHVLASVAGLACNDPSAAVQVISLIKDLLPRVSELNNQSLKMSSRFLGPNMAAQPHSEPDLPSPHYAWVESDHPYKAAGISNYRVVFPSSVKWMAIEFDPGCCTAQPEDTLQLFIRNPASQRPKNLTNPLVTSQTNTNPVKSQRYSPVLTKFSGTKGWPVQSVVLPGNEVLFSLETASDYVRSENKANSYGFKCLVAGYEVQDAGQEGLKSIEHELAYLGGLCSASLMSKTIQLPLPGEKSESNVASAEVTAQDLYERFPSLLSKGFAIDQLPSVHQALSGQVPFSCNSHERQFLKDFVQCNSGTAGGRLASWLQPESYISVANCGVLFKPEEMKCSWPTIITIVARDQYGAVANVPNMKVEVKAVPIDEMNASAGPATARLNRAIQPDSLTFGGHPPPNLETKYEITVKEKMFYHAITVSKLYDNYSFEELRWASPRLQRQSENMLVRPNGDGTYSANWTPGNVGWYKISVSLDGCELPAVHKVEILDPPQGKMPPNQHQKRSCPSSEINRLRQFIAKPSAGLRIRIHPTLQSEQIGVVPVDGTVSIIDELSNSDGIWVRLSIESMNQFCRPGFAEGWCLSYNQHYDKQLMMPVAEPVKLKPAPIRHAAQQQQPQPAPAPLNQAAQLGLATGGPANASSTTFGGDKLFSSARSNPSVKREPGMYTVVKCGASGHNIRCSPSMNAAPIGMLSLSDNIVVTEVKEYSSGECWVKLDRDSMDKFCFNSLGASSDDGDGWSLAVTSTDVHYLESEEEIHEQRWPEASLAAGGSNSFDMRASGGAGGSGFVSPFAAGPSAASASDDGANLWGPLPFQSTPVASASMSSSATTSTPFSPSSSGPPSMSLVSSTTSSTKACDSNQSTPQHRRKSLPRPVGRHSTPPRQPSPMEQATQPSGGAQASGGSSGSASSPAAGLPLAVAGKSGIAGSNASQTAATSATAASSSTSAARSRSSTLERKSFFQKWFKSDDSGAGGAAGAVPAAGPSRKLSSPYYSGEAMPGSSRKSSIINPAIMVNKDIPPELQGVSVKELVKVIGASRANGNGVTPPSTPGTPRKSRSASPAGGAVSQLAFSRSRSSSPISIGHGKIPNTSSSALGLSASPRSLSAGISALASSSPETSGQSLFRQSSTSSANASVESWMQDSKDYSIVSPSKIRKQFSDVSSSPIPSKSESGDDGGTLDGRSPKPSDNDSAVFQFSGHMSMEATNTSLEGIASQTCTSTSSGPDQNASQEPGPSAAAAPANQATLKEKVAGVKPKIAEKPQSTKSMLSARQQQNTANPQPSTSNQANSSRGGSGLGAGAVVTPTSHHPALDYSGPVREAMSPSVAESIRSVFAAFVWHSGVVHDIMACASFLKFNSGLTKAGDSSLKQQHYQEQQQQEQAVEPSSSQPVSVDDLTEINNSSEAESSSVKPKTAQDVKVKQRHSLEVSMAAAYFANSLSSADAGADKAAYGGAGGPHNNKNMNNSNSMHRRFNAADSRKVGPSHMEMQYPGSSGDCLDAVSGLPPTLGQLVLLWEGIVLTCLDAILCQARPLVPSSAATGKTPFINAGTRDVFGNLTSNAAGNKSSASGRSANYLMSPLVPSSRTLAKKNHRNNLEQGGYVHVPPSGKENTAANAMHHQQPLSAEEVNALRETLDYEHYLCDICGGHYEPPITFHMKVAHPGCGSRCGNKGYNSSGQYSNGWSGNCGEGGHGQTSWYLLCEKCRDAHKKKHQDSGKAAAGNQQPSSVSHGQQAGGSAKMMPLSLPAMLASFSYATSNSPVGTLDCHMVMKSNAMFLLDLAGSSALGKYYSGGFDAMHGSEAQRCANDSFGTTNTNLSHPASFSGNPVLPSAAACDGPEHQAPESHAASSAGRLASAAGAQFPHTQFNCLLSLVGDNQLDEFNSRLQLEEKLRTEAGVTDAWDYTFSSSRASSRASSVKPDHARHPPPCEDESSVALPAADAGFASGGSPGQPVASSNVLAEIEPPKEFQTNNEDEVGASSLLDVSGAAGSAGSSGSNGGSNSNTSSSTGTVAAAPSKAGASGNDSDSDSVVVVVRRNKFNRSVSIGGKDSQNSAAAAAGLLAHRQKRYTSHEEHMAAGMAVSSAEFLAHTSQAWQQLFNSNDSRGGPAAASNSIATKLLDSSVVSFLLQWNDLDSLQSAMKLSLRKAVCRSYAMEAFNWLLRSVSQPVCLHDLLWCFISALQQHNQQQVATPSPPVNSSGNQPQQQLNGAKAGGAAAGGAQQPAAPPNPGAACVNNAKKDKDEANNAVVKNEAAEAAAAASSVATQARRERELGFEHPMSDLGLVGGAVRNLPSTFHQLLQTISDLMLLLPIGSALQQAAITCFAIQFWPSDHAFLHQCQVFSTISKILSRGESDGQDPNDHSPKNGAGVAVSAAAAVAALGGAAGSGGAGVERWSDMTAMIELTVSSRTAMVSSLTDGSTETFWESGDEDRNKTRFVVMRVPNGILPRSVAVHVDNGRDIGNKVSSLVFKAGKTPEESSILRVVDVESRYCGWLNCFLTDADHPLIKIEVRGPDNTVRLRQVKLIGQMVGDGSAARNAVSDANKSLSAVSSPIGVPPPALPGNSGAVEGRAISDSWRIQQANCETETLRVFRLITSQVFGKLLEPDEPDNLASLLSNNSNADSAVQWRDDGTDLKEHVVSILFSRGSKLSHLQKQVCAHIVSAIAREAAYLREQWEVALCSGLSAVDPDQSPPASDTYCFEMLSMVLALSGSKVGRVYLSQQYSLIKDLLSFLHTGSARVQRAVVSVLGRVLPLVAPARLANLLNIPSLPPRDFTILNVASQKVEGESGDKGLQFDPDKVGILDIFLACIAKALNIQVKKKRNSGRSLTSVRLSACIPPRGSSNSARWWLRGNIDKQIAEKIIALLKDMTQGKFSEDWAAVTKSAIAEAVLNLTRLEPAHRVPDQCLKSATLWLAMAALTVLDKDHVEGLSSGEWGGGTGGGGSHDRPYCDNHDDGETPAIILCDSCGNLCSECDRFLHLHRRTRLHSRQVFKEEEEAIKVNLHEGCGRTKLFWLTAASDSGTLKAVIEFREEPARKSNNAIEAACRYCGGASTAGLPVLEGVCSQEECQENARKACTNTNPCGHPCGGIAGEKKCLPCLHGCDKTAGLKQDGDDMCMICFTEPLSPIPSILMECGHVFHLNCARGVLSAKWHGPRITFGFTQCPICKSKMRHDALQDLLEPIDKLYEDVKKKALMRLEYEGLSKCEAVATEGARFFNNPTGFALERYAYYVCFKCGKAYFGGEARCDLEAGGETYNPEELVCGGCSDVSQAQMCPKHGTDYLEYKCRYCCSVAVFFCFGTTHFCNPCHDDFQRLVNIPKPDLPQCPVAPKGVNMDDDECPLHVKHPPTGEEFALGCGICRNAHTF